MSPEQICEEAAYNEKSDVWSLGCVLYELCNLHPPFEAQNHLQLAIKIKDGKFKPIHTRYSTELQTVIHKLLTIDATSRLSIPEVLKLAPIAVRVREIQLHQQYAALKKREKLVQQREEAVAMREKLVEQKMLQVVRSSNNNSGKQFVEQGNNNTLANNKENIFKNFKLL